MLSLICQFSVKAQETVMLSRRLDPESSCAVGPDFLRDGGHSTLQIVEEISYQYRVARVDSSVVHPFTDREIEDPKPERREDYRTRPVHHSLAGHYLGERPGYEVATACELLSQMRRRLCVHDVVDVIDHVARPQEQFGGEVTER